jgi:hypothetical protein
MRLAAAMTLFVTGVMVFVFHDATARAETFDFHNGNAPVEVVIPAVIPVVYQFVSPTPRLADSIQAVSLIRWASYSRRTSRACLSSRSAMNLVCRR